MVRRVYADDDVAVSETRTVESAPIASTIANVISVLYVAILSLIGLDTLLEALGAREDNGFVSAIDTLSAPFMAPFKGVFDNQQYWATALIAAAVYTVIYLIAMAALRRPRTTVY
jgi:fluoride ion exporter CrcB/FEX